MSDCPPLPFHKNPVDDPGEVNIEGYEAIDRKDVVFQKPKDLFKKMMAYKFSTGWCRGVVQGQVTRKSDADYGKFIVKFVGYNDRECLTLDMEDYDSDDIWVLQTSP